MTEKFKTFISNEPMDEANPAEDMGIDAEVDALLSPTVDGEPKPKRKRRTKAEMAAERDVDVPVEEPIPAMEPSPTITSGGNVDSPDMSARTLAEMAAGKRALQRNRAVPAKVEVINPIIEQDPTHVPGFNIPGEPI